MVKRWRSGRWLRRNVLIGRIKNGPSTKDKVRSKRDRLHGSPRRGVRISTARAMLDVRGDHTPRVWPAESPAFACATIFIRKRKGTGIIFAPWTPGQSCRILFI